MDPLGQRGKFPNWSGLRVQAPKKRTLTTETLEMFRGVPVVRVNEFEEYMKGILIWDSRWGSKKRSWFMLRTCSLWICI